VTTYQILVRGRLPAGVLPGFTRRTRGLAPTELRLRGWLPEQAALPALLTRLEELGVQVVEVRRLPASPSG
jgi:hypothetical protein